MQFYTSSLSSLLPSISFSVSFFPLLSSPPLSLTECCGASAAGCLPICYITVPPASLKHCGARLASARLPILLSYLKCCPAAKRLSVWALIALAFLISGGKLIISGASQAETSTIGTTLRCTVSYGPSIVIMQGWGRMGTWSLSLYVYMSGWWSQPTFSHSLCSHLDHVKIEKKMEACWDIFQKLPVATELIDIPLDSQGGFVTLTWTKTANKHHSIPVSGSDIHSLACLTCLCFCNTIICRVSL